MSYVSTRNKFHVALNGVGLLLQGAPDRPGYIQGQAAVYGQRFASGDRDYNDLSQWWYFMQTDWSGGIKDQVSWANDAKYYYSTNIDTWSEGGAIKLCRRPIYDPDEDFAYDISCGHEGEVNGSVYKFVATSNEADDRPHIYRASSGLNETFTDISTTTIGTNQNLVSQMSTRLGILWFSTVGVGSTWGVGTYNGTAFTDQSANIVTGASLTADVQRSICHAQYSGVMYVFVDNYSNNQFALVKTLVANPTAAGDWSNCFEMTNTDGLPADCASYNGNIYYLVRYSYHVELWQYNIAGDTNVFVRRFEGAAVPSYASGGRLMIELNGKLLITVPNNEIWQIDGSTLTRIFVKDEFKRTTGGNEVDCNLYGGAVISGNKAWWGNLMYDGSSFFNTWKNYSDSTHSVYPLFTDTSGRIWFYSGADNTKLYAVDMTSGAYYKGTDNKNYLVFSNFDNIAGVDKMGYSAIVIFKPLLSGQSIEIEYLTGEFSTSASWTSLGTASYSVDGGTINNKTLFFPIGTTFKKIWFRVKLEGGGTDTPVMYDMVMEYLPAPTFKKNWTLNINAANELSRLDGQPFGTTGRELRALLEHAWWTKSLLDFQDLDYATTQLNGALNSSATTVTVDDTVDFPDKGRIKIDNEEIFYTGKTPTTFTGCTRGQRSSAAVAHSDDAVVNNAYKVMITDLNTRVPIALKEKSLEYIISLSIREG